MLGERTLELHINVVSCGTIETRKKEEPSRKFSPVKGEGGSVPNRHKVAKPLDAAHVYLLAVYGTTMVGVHTSLMTSRRLLRCWRLDINSEYLAITL